MTERLVKRVNRIAGKIKDVLSGPSNRPTVYFIPPDPVSEMYRVVNEGIQEKVEQRRKALEATKRLRDQEAIKNTLKASTTKKLELRSARATRRDIIQKINCAKQGGGAFDPHYAKVMVEWNEQLAQVTETINRLSDNS